MLGWTLAFFVAAIIAAAFGFGAIASTFADIAMILFWVFLALFALSLVASLFSRHSGRVSSGAGTLALVAVAAAVGFFVYAWVDEDMSAEKLGRTLDRETVEITQEIGDGLEDAGERTENFLQNTSAELRTDASRSLDEASDTVAPEQDTASN